MTRSHLLATYQKWRPDVPASHQHAFDAAVQELAELPVDAEGHFAVPLLPTDEPGPPPAAAPPPRPLTRDFGLAPAANAALASLEASGALVEPSVDPLVWHVIYAIPKRSDDVSRARLIADLRSANVLMPAPPAFALPSFLEVARRDRSRAAWAAKLDISSAFYAIGVGAEARRHFAAVAPDGRRIEWAGMPMGWTWAPVIFHRCLGPLRVFLASQGLDVINYLDDFLVLGASADGVQSDLETLADRLHELRFVVSSPKTSAPSRQLVFLGMGLDLETAEFWWPTDKAALVAEEAQSLLAAASARRGSSPGMVDVARLQRLLGRLAFLASVVPLAAAWRRCLDCSLAGASDRSAALSAAAVAELAFWSDPRSSLAGLTFPFAADSRVVLRTDAS